MSYCRSNPHCSCARCRMAGIMGPAVLITLGALFLADTQGAFSLHKTWPLLLIVIGLVKIVQHSSSTEGHMERRFEVPPVVTPPPVPPAGTLPAANPPKDLNHE